MKRVEFRLSMPGRNSWDGRWSGGGRNYAIVRTVTDKKAAELEVDKGPQSWGYGFGDGWFASVTARIVPKGERLKKSNGFCGYDWMVGSIVAFGEILTPDQQRERLRPPATPAAGPGETAKEEKAMGEGAEALAEALETLCHETGLAVDRAPVMDRSLAAALDAARSALDAWRSKVPGSASGSGRST